VDIITNSTVIKETIRERIMLLNIDLDKLLTKLGIEKRDYRRYMNTTEPKRSLKMKHKEITELLDELGIKLKLTLIYDDKFKPDNSLTKPSVFDAGLDPY